MRWCLVLSFVIGCGGSEEAGTPDILPHLSPASFGDIKVLPDGQDPEPGSKAFQPYEWVLLLQNTGTADLTITEVCIVGDQHNGGENDRAFAIEGPVPEIVPPGTEAAVRLTYDPSSKNIADVDGDQVPDPDRVAVIVQSDAGNFPTLIVPVCARLVEDGDEYPEFHCDSPVSLTPGAVDLSLCGSR